MVKLVSNKIYREVVVRGGVPYHLGLHQPWLTPIDTMETSSTAALCLIQRFLMAREFREKKVDDCAKIRASGYLETETEKDFKKIKNRAVDTKVSKYLLNC